MPCLVTWLRQLTWFIARFPRIVKKKQSLTQWQRPNYPFSCRKGPYTKEAVNCKSSCQLSLLSSNLIMWSIISAATALHPRHGIPQRISMKTFAYPYMQSWEAVWSENHINIFITTCHVIPLHFLCSGLKKLILDFLTRLLLVVSNLPNMHLTSSRGDFTKSKKHCFIKKKSLQNSVFLVQEWRCWLRDGPVAESSITLMRPQPLSYDSTATRWARQATATVCSTKAFITLITHGARQLL